MTIGAFVGAAAAPIHEKAAAGDAAAMNAMCAADEKCLIERDGMGSTPLHHAALKGHIKIVRYLVMKKVKVNAKNSNGMTPVHMAAMSENKAAGKEIVEFLASCGAGIDEPAKYNETPLLCAALFGNFGVMELLLSKGANINSKGAGQSSVLLEVVEGQRLPAKYDIMKFLLEKGADPNLGDVNGFTPLQRAVMSLGTREVNLLIDMKADVNLGNKEANTPLSWAVDRKNFDMVKLLVDRGARINDVRQGPCRRWTAVHEAAGAKNAEIMRYLISKGADLSKLDSDLQTPIFYAARAGDFEMVKLLVENGASAKVADCRGRSPIGEAVRLGAADIVSYLKDKSAPTAEVCLLNDAIASGKLEYVEMFIGMVPDINASESFGASPVVEAIKSKNIEIVKLLIARGAVVDGAYHRNNDTPLHYAAKTADESICVLIASKFKDIDIRSLDRKTPLLWAVAHGITANAKFLISKGARTDVVNDDGNTLLHHAAMKCGKEMIDLLIASGAPTGAKNKKGETPLITAARIGNQTLMAALIAKGVSVNERNRNGNTALHYAAWSGREESVDMLIAAGADKKIVNNEGKPPDIKPKQRPESNTMFDRVIKKAVEYTNYSKRN
ncbi:MAG TPA: hypothetical protein DC017_16795 [Candidatus Wallbacteria bacterium]|nr:hypothetical protein [Candidatus Wallbacteria bacterium]